MFLDDQHEARQTIDVEQSAAAEVNLEDLRLWRIVAREVYDASTLFVLAVSLHIQHAIESGLGKMDLNLHAVGETADSHFRSREVSSKFVGFI